MAKTRAVRVANGDVLILVGTTKGMFVYRSDAKRKSWEAGGPFLQGREVFALAFDGRAGRKRIHAAESSMHWGSVLRHSDDFGKSWSEAPEANVKFPEDTKTALKQIWQIRPGIESEANRMFCGVEPAALFESIDAGKSWSLVRGLWNHPHRPHAVNRLFRTENGCRF